MTQKYLFPDEQKLQEAKEAKTLQSAKIIQELEKAIVYGKFLQNYGKMALDIEERTSDRDSMRELTDLAYEQAKALRDSMGEIVDAFEARTAAEQAIAHLLSLKNSPTLSDAI